MHTDLRTLLARMPLEALNELRREAHEELLRRNDAHENDNARRCDMPPIVLLYDWWHESIVEYAKNQTDLQGVRWHEGVENFVAERGLLLTPTCGVAKPK